MYWNWISYEYEQLVISLWVFKAWLNKEEDQYSTSTSA